MAWAAPGLRWGCEAPPEACARRGVSAWPVCDSLSLLLPLPVPRGRLRQREAGGFPRDAAMQTARPASRAKPLSSAWRGRKSCAGAVGRRAARGRGRPSGAPSASPFPPSRPWQDEAGAGVETGCCLGADGGAQRDRRGCRGAPSGSPSVPSRSPLLLCSSQQPRGPEWGAGGEARRPGSRLSGDRGARWQSKCVTPPGCGGTFAGLAELCPPRAGQGVSQDRMCSCSRVPRGP